MELQGKWTIIAAKRDGKQASDKEIENGMLIIDGDKYKFAMGDHVTQGTITIDPTNVPKTIDVTQTEGEDMGKTFLGVYSLEGNILTTCLAAPGVERPDKLTAEANSPHRVYVMTLATR
jgi:uncharacterized protein (TIGR03067 family)